ncbi:MAG: hypothetical protein H6855_05755 [Rhodospirillales bacterium]|nr:hypothetical protein [Rhodospirillales bacterium]MCB9965567.1 hypothetical protein [Rhodospirillales bacterium]
MPANMIAPPARADGCGNPECDCNGWGWGCPAPNCNCQFVTGICDAVQNKYHPDTRSHVTEEIHQMENWIVTDWMQGYLLPSMMAMTEELTTVAMHQVMTIGTFFDARMELQTQRLLQELQAQSYKDYHPSEGVCVFATNVRSLAMSDRKIALNKNILSSRALSRHLGIKNDAGAEGVKTDLGEEFTSSVDNTTYRNGRLRQFQDEYCNPRNNNGKLKFICGNSGAGASDDYRIEHDIDFVDIFAAAKTMNFDFLRTADETSPEEKKYLEDYLALSKNLYGHQVPYRSAKSSFDVPSDFFTNPDAYETQPYSNFLNLRSLLAKRSVVENSFHAQTALKSRGDPEVSYYMNSLLSELGIDGDQISAMLQGAPSYYAQMEILTKKIYQNPRFYVDLYDKPANVNRKQVAMKAIGLMQNWDTFEATMRVEMLSSVLLELEMVEAQNAIQGGQ